MFACRMSQGLDIGRDDSEYTAPEPTEDSVVTFDEFPGLSIANKVGVQDNSPILTLPSLCQAPLRVSYSQNRRVVSCCMPCLRLPDHARIAVELS